MGGAAGFVSYHTPLESSLGRDTSSIDAGDGHEDVDLDGQPTGDKAVTLDVQDSQLGKGTCFW